jgi:putative heme-binding domain-containing protein
MRTAVLILVLLSGSTLADDSPSLPKPAEGWNIELVAQAPRILYPTAIVVAPDGTIYVGQDPMDMPGPPTVPLDSIVAIKDGNVSVFADKLWAVMGLEWVGDTLYVVHAPFLSALQDTNGDGKADKRVDLMTGLGPLAPAFNGINDHVPSGVRLGMDGYLYISIGDKGIPKGVGKDGTTIQLYGGGVIRIRPDGTGLEVVSSGERNPLSVALSATDEIFTYGNDDDSKKWPNSLTHHIVGGHYGYPYQFLNAPDRCLPVVGGQIGGSGTQGFCYNEDGLPEKYKGNLFFCDWGLQIVSRYVVEKAGGTFKLKLKEPLVTRGDYSEFRPFALAVSNDGTSFYLSDWAYNNGLAKSPQTGRLYRLTYDGTDRVQPIARPEGTGVDVRISSLDHPALSVRLASQRALAAMGGGALGPLLARLKTATPQTGRLHALWALDAIGTLEARAAIRGGLGDADAEVRLQAARSAGIRHDRLARTALEARLSDSDPAVRREAAIALGKLGDAAAVPALMNALGDADLFAAWSIRHAIRVLNAWDEKALLAALVDPARRDAALKLTDEAWARPVVSALTAALPVTKESAARAQIVANLAGLYRQYPLWTGNWFGTNPLAGQFPQKTRDWDPAAMSQVLAGLSRAFDDADSQVRREAVAGLLTVGKPAATVLRDHLGTETDTLNLAAIIQALGEQADAQSLPTLVSIMKDGQRPMEVRAAALDALSTFRDRPAMLARLSVVYDKTAPTELVARAVLAAGRAGVLPPNDLVGFLDDAGASVRVAALWSLATFATLSADLRPTVIARLEDSDIGVRKAAVGAIANLKLREAIPRLVELAQEGDLRTEATRALAILPDPRAFSVYMDALKDRNPDMRRAAEQALLAIRDLVAGDLETLARSGKLSGTVALAVERILTRFRPIVDWHVIGPFPRTTPQVFPDDASIDFAQTRVGAAGKTIQWAERKADPQMGRLVIDDFKAGAGDRGGFGYDTNGSPDLAAFGYAEIVADRDRPALLLIGSSGTISVRLNDKNVHNYDNFAGRPYAPDSGRVRVALKQGTNRILVRSRQGIGTWSFSVQISEPSATLFATKPGSIGLDELRAFALQNDGDPARGEAIFFDAKGIGCVKCHSASGRGTANVGPDLSGFALKYDKAEIVRSVLEPSNRIATGYQPVLLAFVNGQVLAGLLRSETATYIDLIDADAKTTRVLKSEIDERRVSDVSLMPTGLVDTLTPAEFADLIAYLQQLKTAPAPQR